MSIPPKVIDNGDDDRIIPWVAIFAGALILLVWRFRLENYCTIIPSSVLEGFSLGVAIVS
jgi:MFS superfamily sulfate permease-like transporter